MSTRRNKDGTAGAVPAADPQRVGPGHEDLPAEGAAQLRPRRPTRPRRHQAAGRVANPAARPGHRPARLDRYRPGRVGVHLLPPGRRHPGPGRAVAPARDRHRHDPAAGRAQARPRTERVLFALVANRALAPGSKLAAAGWVNRRAHIDGLAQTSDDACYRAMDWLLDIAPDLEREVFWQVATLLDHEVDLLFFDTTSTYFETDHPDDPVVRDTHGRPIPDPPPATAETPPPPRTPAPRPPRTRPRGRGARRGGVPDLRQVEGLPRRPAPGRDRHGGHEGRDPGAGVVLAGEHHRLRADPPSPRRYAGLDPGPGDVGRRPRLLLEGEPPRATPRRRALHHRGEAPLGLRGGHRRVVEAGPLPACPGQPAGQRSQHRRGRAVRDLLQPRTSRHATQRCARSWSANSPP